MLKTLFLNLFSLSVNHLTTFVKKLSVKKDNSLRRMRKFSDKRKANFQ